MRQFACILLQLAKGLLGADKIYSLCVPIASQQVPFVVAPLLADFTYRLRSRDQSWTCEETLRVDCNPQSNFACEEVGDRLLA